MARRRGGSASVGAVQRRRGGGSDRVAASYILTYVMIYDDFPRGPLRNDRGYYVTKPRSSTRVSCSGDGISTAELELGNRIESNHQIKCHAHQDRMAERRRDQRRPPPSFRAFSHHRSPLTWYTTIQYKYLSLIHRKDDLIF